ncbi:MAG: hypothetical protein ASARMPRED_008778 [Alectoria sarmentosa]|nr:MAG: hypothetical protein ASARMPRED_008778 [Alectoria sarmentosa]
MATQTQPSVDLSENRGGHILASVTTVLVLAIISTGLRLIARRIKKTKYNASDYAVVVALVCGICDGAISFTGLFLSETFSGDAYHHQGIHYGFGRHVQTLFFAAEIFYILAITFAKFSVLLLYCSIFPGKRFALYAKSIAAVVLVWATVNIFGIIFSCVPVQGFWDLKVKVHSTCINSTKFFIGNAIPNIFTDAAILLLPMRKIWDLHTSAKRKIVVSGIFLMGGFVIVASILRLAFLLNENLADPTFGLVNMFTWSNIEVDVAVLSASLPTLRPVFQKMWPSHLITMYGRALGKGSGRSERSDVAFAMPNMDRSARKNFQSLDDGNGYSVTSVAAQGDLEQGDERFDGIRIKREVVHELEDK